MPGDLGKRTGRVRLEEAEPYLAAKLAAEAATKTDHRLPTPNFDTRVARVHRPERGRPGAREDDEVDAVLLSGEQGGEEWRVRASEGFAASRLPHPDPLRCPRGLYDSNSSFLPFVAVLSLTCFLLPMPNGVLPSGPVDGCQDRDAQRTAPGLGELDVGAEDREVRALGEGWLLLCGL